MSVKTKYIVWFENTELKDVPIVGGKNASLGEMIQNLKPKGIQVPDGFALTSSAYNAYLEFNNLTQKVHDQLEAYRKGSKKLQEAGEAIRGMFLSGEIPQDLADLIKQYYRELSLKYKLNNVSVAVRSSATAEDLPDASFAGQQETFLNISGEKQLMDACRHCYSSLFTDRAISYREEKGFEHMKVALSIGVQKMVRSDLASSGVIFTLDPDTGFRDVVVITSSLGLGESIVQGIVNPDEFVVYKPLLDKPGLKPIIGKNMGNKETKMIYGKSGTRTIKLVDTSESERTAFSINDNEILKLARWACDIENHYKKPMDIEWAKDGETGELFIVQARPETVESLKKGNSLKSYKLKQKGNRLLTGLSIGQSIGTGKVQVIKAAAEIEKFVDGSVLVTGMTDPDWVPIMRRASAIITDLGGRTS
ncbi:MAG: PEP-utilizing enzyme, partial [Chloroflexi bacterium]|nr:PEP-utilizing enzyme [Chloroflexota bacterium]